MKEKTNVGFSVHTYVMETCIVKCSNNNNIIKHLKQIYSVFCPGFQKGRVPSEKGTFSTVNGPSKGHH